MRNIKLKNLAREERILWMIKYYKKTLGEQRSKKKIGCTKEEVIPLLVVSNKADPGSEDLGNRQ